jgi:pre-mRNA-processing factor 39
VNKLREVYSRACLIHHKNKPWINLYWCFFEESEGNYEKVRNLFKALEKKIPDSLQIQYRRIQFERRRGNVAECEKLFQEYIETASDKSTAIRLTIKYAYFVQYNYEKAKEILEAVSTEDEALQAKAIMAIIDMGFRYRDSELISSYFQKILQSSVSKELRVNFAHRNVEFQEECGTVDSIEAAHDQLMKISKSLRESKNNEMSESTDGGTDSTGQGSSDYNQYGQYASWNPHATNYVPTAPSSGSTYNQQSWSGYGGQTQSYYG